jgi:hypothetical protein
MPKRLRSSLLCVLAIVASVAFAFSAEDDLSGFTLKQLDAAITKSGGTSERLYSILTFDSEERSGANVAVLSSSRSGWHVAVLHRITGGLDVQWHSGRLPDDFSMSSSRNLIIDKVGDEQVVEFSGCALHDCGSVNGVFGLLLYSPRSNQVFFAHYRFDDRKPISAFGSLEFSENSLEPGNERYKDAVQKAVHRVLHE